MASVAPDPAPSRPQRHIVVYPDPILLRRSEPVERIDERIRGLLDDMVRIMQDEEGAGIAAPQVGENLRIFIVEAREATENRPAEALGIYINPALFDADGGVEPFEEGCLSLPGIRADIRRPPKIRIEATDGTGQRFTRTDDGILARIWQHEFDHLEGTLILDRMSTMDKLATRKKVKELREEYELKASAPAIPPSSRKTSFR